MDLQLSLKGPCVIWFYGLSGAGKSTLAKRLLSHLVHSGTPAVLIDGDELRSGLCKDLGFCSAERAENVRRAAEVANLLSRQGLTVLVARMTPEESMRQVARSTIEPTEYHGYLCLMLVKSMRDA